MATKPKIKKKMSKYNNSTRVGAGIVYIVIHYVGAVSSAKNNATYFANGDRQASAHFFVDENEIWQSVEISRAAWHCGGGIQSSKGHTFYGKAKNSNSIGIEMCVKKKDGKWFYEPKTIENTGKLVRWLMEEYGIPASNVIRHFDVTGKACPANYLTDSTWKALKEKLTAIKVNYGTGKTYTGKFPSLGKKGYLAEGDKSTDVKKLQEYLNWATNAKLFVDGSFGTKTLAKVKAFQKKYSLDVDGMFGKESLAAAKKVKR